MHNTDSRGMILVPKESPCYGIQFDAICLKIGWEFVILEQKEKARSYLIRTQNMASFEGE